MRKTKMTQVLQEITEDIICNRCDGSCKGEYGNFNGLIEAKVAGAGDSTHLEDFHLYTFSLCEKCLSELFVGFSIKPDIQWHSD